MANNVDQYNSQPRWRGFVIRAAQIFWYAFHFIQWQIYQTFLLLNWRNF